MLLANLMRTLDRKQFEAGMIRLLEPPFLTDLVETLARDGIPVWHLGKRQSFDLQMFVRLARILDHVKPHHGSALSLHLQGLAQRAPSLDKHEELR